MHPWQNVGQKSSPIPKRQHWNGGEGDGTMHLEASYVCSCQQFWQRLSEIESENYGNIISCDLRHPRLIAAIARSWTLLPHVWSFKLAITTWRFLIHRCLHFETWKWYESMKVMEKQRAQAMTNLALVNHDKFILWHTAKQTGRSFQPDTLLQKPLWRLFPHDPL